MSLSCSPGELPSQIKAVLSPKPLLMFASMQFHAKLVRPPLNHECSTFPLVISKLLSIMDSLCQGASHTNSEAMLDQNSSGFSIEVRYSSWYSSSDFTPTLGSNMLLYASDFSGLFTTVTSTRHTVCSTLRRKAFETRDIPPPQLFPYLYARLDIQVSLMPMIIPAVTAAVLPRRVSFAENMDTKKEVFSLKGYSTSGSFLLTQCPLARDGGWSARGRMRARAREGVARDDDAAAAADADDADARDIFRSRRHARGHRERGRARVRGGATNARDDARRRAPCRRRGRRREVEGRRRDARGGEV